MIKNIKESDAPVTKGMLDGAVEEIITKIDKKIDEKIDGAIGGLAIMVEKGFQGMVKQMDARFEKVDTRFDKVFSELKEVHKEIEVNNLKAQGDIARIDFRVGKLEKKAQP